MEDIISRKFTKQTSYTRKDGTVCDNTLVFDYKTKSRVFDVQSCNIHGFLSSVIIEGRQSFDRSPSSEKLLVLDIEKVDSAIVQLAKEADYENCENWQHRKVQDFFMARDNRTIAVEIPLWSKELNMSGFADILRHFPANGDTPEMFQLLDFKPGAKSEKKAATQLYWLKKLLCECSMIKPEQVICCYFDNVSAYQIKT